jgi:hypothetical protein
MEAGSDCGTPTSLPSVIIVEDDNLEDARDMSSAAKTLAVLDSTVRWLWFHRNRRKKTYRTGAEQRASGDSI